MSAPQQNAPVEIWYTRCGGATASTIAIQNDWLHEEFKDDGIVLSSVRDSPNPEIRESHFDHSITSMFREGGNIPPIWARAKGADSVVLAITWVDEFQSIVIRPQSSVREISDLKGKRLAVPLHRDISIDFQRGAAFHGFAHALDLAGLGRSDVQFVDVPVEQGLGGHEAAVLAALETGAVDAVFLRQGSGYKLAQQHAGNLRELLKITDLEDPLHRVNNGTPRPLTVHRAFLDRHPDLVVRYLAVLLRSAAWAETHPEDAIRAVAAEDGRHVDEAVVAGAYPKLSVSLTPKLTEDYIRGLETQKNFLRDWGFLAADFPLRAWIEAGPLEEARRLVAGAARTAA